MVDVIKCAIFGDCGLRRVGVVRGVILPFPIDLRYRPYNTGHTVRVIWFLVNNYANSIYDCCERKSSHDTKWTLSATILTRLNENHDTANKAVSLQQLS